MSRGVIFWVLMILVFVFGVFSHWGGGSINYMSAGMSLLQFVLFALLGWQVFGPAVHG